MFPVSTKADRILHGGDCGCLVVGPGMIPIKQGSSHGIYIFVIRDKCLRRGIARRFLWISLRLSVDAQAKLTSLLLLRAAHTTGRPP